jgi:WD40 repeat protein
MDQGNKGKEKVGEKKFHQSDAKADRNALADRDKIAIRLQDTTDRSIFRYPERLTEIHTLRGHTDEVSTVAVSADGKWLVSGSRDKAIRIWDLKTGTCLNTLQGHTDAVTSVAVSADSQRLVSASFDKTIRIWDLKTGTCLNTLRGHTNWVWSVAVSADGQRLVSASNDKTIKIWGVK